ncbi:MAG: hypothetical protein K2L01_02740 [Rikenellaceae bacterium]|nr:hypothetical protein [Rikenellaceae bacterium]
MKRDIAGILMLSTVLFSCDVTDDFENLTLGINTSMPLGTIKFSEASLFELSDVDTSVIRYDDEGVMVLSDSVEVDLIGEKNLDDILSVTFPDNNAPIVAGGSSSAGDYPVSTTVTYRMNITGSEQLTEVTLSRGTLTFSANDALRDVTCSVAEITDRSGRPLTIRPGQSVDLSDGYVIKPAAGNTLKLQYTGTVHTSGRQEAEMHFSDMEIFSARGYFGRKEISTTVADVTIDEGTNSFLANVDELYLVDPKIEIVLDNTFRLPVGIIVESLTYNGRKILLKDGYNITRHLVGEGRTVITIDNESTESGEGISRIINKDLKEVSLSIKAIVNPTDEDMMAPAGTVVPERDNYYDRDCRVSTVIRFGMPLWGVFGNISYTDSYDVDFAMSEMTLQNAVMAIAGSNTFPLTLSLDMYSVDYDDNEKRLTKESIVIPSTSDNLPADRVTPAVLGQDNYLLTELDAETINRMDEVSKIRLRIGASSLDADKRRNIKIYKGSSLDLRLTIGVQGSMDLD